MHDLLYSFDGRLLDGERELVGFDPTQGPFGRLSHAGAEFDIARRKPSGWHMELLDARTAQRACEFTPHRMGRGGKLRAADGTVRLRGRLVGPSHWRFTAQGAGIEATAHPLRTAGHRSFRKLEVDLQGGDWVGAPPIAPLTLAFGCWLIVQWETDVTPAVGIS